MQEKNPEKAGIYAVKIGHDNGETLYSWTFAIWDGIQWNFIRCAESYGKITEWRLL